MADGDLVTLAWHGDVAMLSLNDPATLNAASIKMVERLLALLDDVSGHTRCILLTGSGRAFCSGANLSGGMDVGSPDYDAGGPLDTHYNPLVERLRQLPVPVVTAVNGAAAGIGASLALIGDLIVAADSSYFLQAFRKIGLVPDGGSAYLLVHAAGRARASEMMLLGKRIPAAQALEWGLVNRVVPAENLVETALDLATQLATGPTAALSMIRRLCWEAVSSDFSTMLALERALQREAGLSADHREGIAAFTQKRPPAFKGT
jgi:2-(1,2-epoxy-1,2-dihydrophenyl)acetyl-CoA isomerase